MRKNLLGLLIVSLALALIQPIAVASVKPGTMCKKLGQTSTTAGIKYTCIKSGKKLVWNKGVAVKRTTATPTPIATPIPTPSATPTATASPIPTPSPTATRASFEITDAGKFKNFTTCQISTKLNTSEHYGFPRPKDVIPTLGERRAIALFVYFDDLPFEQRQIEEWRNNQIPTFERYIEKMSFGKLKYKVDMHLKPLHIKKSVLTYNLDTDHDAPQKPNANAGGLVSDAVMLADADIDFSKYEFINVITPWTKLIGFEGTTGIRLTADGKQFNYSSFGPIREYVDDPTKNIWLLHEVGHMMGLIHQFNVRGDWGRTGYPIWSAMANGTSALPEFMAWEKFLLNWFSADQVRCIDGADDASYTIKLTSLSETDSGVKVAMVKLAANQILVIESRRTSSLGTMSKSEEGVLAYFIDADIRGNEGTVTPIFVDPRTRRLPSGGGALIGTLQKGDSVSSKGFKIEVLDADSLSDVIRISKG